MFPAVVEWMPTRGRTVAGVLLGFSFTLGQLILAGVAYLVRPWRWLQFAVSVPFLIFSLYSWYVPSSAGGRCPVWAPVPLAGLGVRRWGLLRVVAGDTEGGAQGPWSPSGSSGKPLPWLPEQTEGFCLCQLLWPHNHLPAFHRRGLRHRPGRVHD